MRLDAENVYPAMKEHPPSELSLLRSHTHVSKSVLKARLEHLRAFIV